MPEPPALPGASLDSNLAAHIAAARSNVIATPKSAEAWGKLGESFHAAEFTAPAMLCYSNAARLDTNSFRWEYLLGYLQLQSDVNAAIPHLQRATELAGAVEPPRLELSRALIERGRLDEAARHLQVLLAANQNHAVAHVEMARVFLARGALKEATGELQPALTNSYTMRQALLIASQIAQRNNQPDVAAQLARRAASLPRPFDWPDPILRDIQSLRTDRARLAEQANAFLQQQRLADAEMVLMKVLTAFPDDAEALLLTGRLRFQQKRCAEAETFLRRHLVVQINSLNGLMQLGLALLCQERWKDAATQFEQVLALKPDFAQAHSNLGLARSRAGDSAGAIRAYRDALRCSPGEVNAHFALAEELANAGDLEAAKEHVRRAAALSPNDPRLPAAREQLGLRP